MIDIRVRDLHIVTDEPHPRPILDGVDWTVRTGAIHAVVGESGSGKTTLALTIFGRVRPGLRLVSGTVQVGDFEPLAARKPAVRSFRRTRLAWLGQDPALSLTSHLTVRKLIAEQLPDSGRGTDTDSRIDALLASVGLRDLAGALDRRPRQLSGGQRRRVAIARALAPNPELLVLDEPTSGLDSDALDDVVATVQRAREQFGLTVVMVTHDMSLARRVSDDISVMADGRIHESGPTADVVNQPSSPVTSALFRAELAPQRNPLTNMETSQAKKPATPVLSVTNLHAHTPAGGPVATGLTFTLGRGEALAVVGASGVGKTTVARTLLGTLPATQGQICLQGCEQPYGLADRSPSDRCRVQLIGQDPMSSLNPSVSVGRQLVRAVRRRHRFTGISATRAEVHRDVTRLLESVGLDASTAHRRPRTLSGGQAQRVAIARAIAAGPSVLLCDEATSSLDPTVQQSILDLFRSLRDDTGLALLVVTHDDHVASYLCSRVLTLTSNGGYHWDHDEPRGPQPTHNDNRVTVQVGR